MGKGTNQTTTTTAPNPQAGAAYSQLLTQAGNVAATPYQSYNGELTAPVNAQQQQGIAGINQYANAAQPYLGEAGNYLLQAAQPVNASTIAQYQSPYTQQVVNATTAQLNQMDAMQQSQLTGNAAAQSALGGNRVGIAQGTLGGQQALANNSTIAGLYNQGFTQALGEANTEQQNLSNVAYGLGNVGTAAQNAGLAGATAQVGAGSLQQQTQQAQDTTAYQQFQNQQAYPFQTTQWLAGLDTGVGSQMGGTSSTTAPAPSVLGQIAGLGLTGAGIVGGTGGFGANGWLTGLLAKDGGAIEAPKGLASGGVPGAPWSGGLSYVPTMQITSGRGAPPPPAPYHDTASADLMKGATGIAGLFKSGNKGSSNTPAATSSSATPAGFAPTDSEMFNLATGDVAWRGGRKQSRPMTAGFGTGGMVRPHLADGGSDSSFDDRFAMAYGSPPPDAVPVRTVPAPGLVPPQDSGDGGQPPSWATPLPNGPGRGMSVAGLASAYAPGFENNYGIDDSKASWNEGVRQSGDRYKAAQAGLASPPADVVNPRSVNGQPQNLTGDIIPPGGFGGGPAPDLGSPIDVADTRPTGLSGAAAYAPETSGAAPATAQETSSSGLSPAFWTALTAAGLGMMSSRSPFPGVAIGEGGLKGLSSYAESQQAEEKKKKTEADIEHGRKQLELTAKHYQQQIEMETKKIQQGEERLQQGKFSVTAGDSIDPVTGQKIPGSILTNTRTGEQKFNPSLMPTGKGATGADKPSFDQGTLTKMADQYLAGDKSVLVNLGRGTQGATDLRALRQRIAERMDEHGVTPEQQAVKMAEFQGMTAGQRALGTRTAQVEMASNEARNMMKPAREAMDAIPRTSWVPINKLIQGWQTGVLSDPAQARAAATNFALVNTYVRAIAPTGVPPESAREHALQMLSGAMSHESYNAVLDVMDKEMEAAQHAPGQVMEKFRQMYGSAPGTSPSGGGASPASPGAGNAGPPPAAARPGPPPAAVNMLRQNPGLRAQFDAKYGAGASVQVLGQ